MKTPLFTLIMILFLAACSGTTESGSTGAEAEEKSSTGSAEAVVEDPVTDIIAEEAEEMKMESEKLEQKADSILNSI